MIERDNKFEAIDAEIQTERKNAKDKRTALDNRIAGTGQTKVIHDKNGRVRHVEVKEPRKVLPVYIPQSLFDSFNEINRAYGISNSSAICTLIRDYVTDKKDVLNEI